MTLAGVLRSLISPVMGCVQILGVPVALVWAAFNIRSILLSGPVFSATGMAIAIASYWAMRPWGLVLGLAPPTMTVWCFCIIFGLQLSPDEALVPISSLLLVFGFAHMAVSLFAVREMIRTPLRDRPRQPFQFSIATMLGLMLVLSLSLGLSRCGEGGIAAGLFVGYTSLVAYMAWRFHLRISSDASLPPGADEVPAEGGLSCAGAIKAP